MRGARGGEKGKEEEKGTITYYTGGPNNSLERIRVKQFRVSSRGRGVEIRGWGGKGGIFYSIIRSKGGGKILLDRAQLMGP